MSEGPPDEPARRRVRWLALKRPLGRWTTLILGWALVVLGVAGLFLPFLQGVALIVLGLLVLSRELPWAKVLLDRLKRRYPRLATSLRRMRRRFKLGREHKR